MLRQKVRANTFFCISSDKILDRRPRIEYLSCPFPDNLLTTIISIMRSVTVRKGEPIDRALKRLKTKLDTEGILEEMRRRRTFESPMAEKRRKARSANKRNKVKWRFTNKEEIPAAAVTPAVEA
jgi:small subunit ribosomal protein S21